MCIAILKTKEGNITDEELKNCFNNNPDGAGIAYTVKNHLIIEKGIFDVKKFIKKVRKAETVCDGNMLIHCRISTSGNIDEENSHPFFVNSNLALIHNGVLDIDVPKNSPKNDTRIYIESYLQGFTTHDLIHNEALKNLIGFSIGTNKFVMLNSANEYAIINEDYGHWVNGTWFSNHSYEPKQTIYQTNFWDKWDDKDDYDETQFQPYTSKADVVSYLNMPEVSAEVEQFINSLNELDFQDFGCNPLIDIYEEPICLYNRDWFSSLPEGMFFLEERELVKVETNTTSFTDVI